MQKAVTFGVDPAQGLRPEQVVVADGVKSTLQVEKRQNIIDHHQVQVKKQRRHAGKAAQIAVE